jgi:hypothetical protein
MRRAVIIVTPIIAFACCARAQAVDFSFQGYADFRVIAPDGETSWIDGGLGKFRYGGTQPDPDFRFAEAVGQATVSFTGDLRAVTTLRVEPEQRTGVDALDAYLAYTPASGDVWNWSAKVGTFFPPFSLENTDLGWTSPYTLTPSAIDSWFGDELRTIGGEASVRRQTSLGTFALTAALFCCDDPAGVLIADRGWSLDDRPTGLFEEPHLPDATLRLFGRPAPDRTPIFKEIDNRIGWYAGARWSPPGIGTLSLYRYDNDADPSAHDDDYFAWHTRFWSAGWESHFGAFAVLAQALRGDTTIEPTPASPATTSFQSAYALLAYDITDEWRISGRAETFSTHRAPFSPLNENGHAFTAALSWSPRDWVRVTGEVIDLDSTRAERVLEGISSAQSQTQYQLSARFFLL